MAATTICEWDGLALARWATRPAASFSVGGVSFCCEPDTPFSGSWGKLDLFATETSINDRDLRIIASRVPKIPVTTGAPAFDSGALWELSYDGEELVFDFTSPAVGSAPYKRM